MTLPIDRPIPHLRGRTARELLLIAVGLYFLVFEELRSGSTDWANCVVYGLATLAFAVRFFPARAVGVGTALAAIAQRWSALRAAGMHASDFDWTAWAPFGVLMLLASRDLAAKYDEAPTGIPWLPNLWGGLPRPDARRLRWCAYALAIVAALLFKRLQSLGGWGSVAHWQAEAMTVALILAVALLALGRASVLLAIPPLAALVAVAAVRALPSSELQLGLGDLGPNHPEYVLPALGCALAAGALALPYAARLLRRRLAA